MKKQLKTVQEIKITYSPSKLSKKSVRTSLDASTIAREIFSIADCHIELKEYFVIILLNRANQPIGYHKLSEGGLSGTVVDIRLAFAIAIKSLSCGMILVHNHPSGNQQPSSADISLTTKFINAGTLLDVPVLDHIILTSEGYCSFADEGHLV